MSFYGNIINTPTSFQKVGVGENTYVSAQYLGSAINFIGDNLHIETAITNDNIVISHIPSSENITHETQVNPVSTVTGASSAPIVFTHITGLNIDEVGHINLLQMKNYNLELVGKKYRDDDNVLRGEIFNDYNDNVASGAYSHAEGLDTEASGYVAHSEGWKTKASGGQGHAEGRSTQALSNTDHAEGFETIAHGAYRVTTGEGYGAHAEGRSTQALGQSSHAEGYSSIADGTAAHAEGKSTTAEGEAAHAEGEGTHAKSYAHAGGYGSKAYANYSFVHGLGLISPNLGSSVVFGQYNDNSENDNIFSIGYGASNDNRKNIFNIKTNGNINTNGIIDAKDVISNNGNNLSLMNIQVEDAIDKAEFTIKQGNQIWSIKKPLNAMVNRAERVDIPDKGVCIRLYVNTSDPKAEDYVDIPMADVLLSAQVGNTTTISLTVPDTGKNKGNIIGYINDKSITEGLIADKAVTNDKLSGGITNDKLSGGITADKINSVYSSCIEGTINTSNLEGLINNDQLGENIDGKKIVNLPTENLTGLITSEQLENKYLLELNPQGTGSLSLNRKTETKIGINSIALGTNIEAQGNYSYAEGYNTKAIGKYTHAEGFYTNAYSEYQHVQGKANLIDSQNKYAHIVGNGDVNHRSNAYTLDWEGNGWFSGEVAAQGIEVDYIILKSSSENTKKKFKLTINDEAIISLDEIEEETE